MKPLIYIIHKPEYLQDILNIIDCHLKIIMPIVDDICRDSYIEELILGKLNNRRNTAIDVTYLYTTDAYNHKSSYMHFELFDNLISDTIHSLGLECIVSPLLPVFTYNKFKVLVESNLGVVTVWIK